MYGGDYRRCGEYTIDVLNKDTCAVVRYHGNERELEIPEYIEGFRVIKVGLFVDEDGFHGHGVWFDPFDDSPVQELKLPDSVEEIENRALASSNLRAVYLNKRFMCESMDLSDPNSFPRRVGIANCETYQTGTTYIALRAILAFR